jgi:hypothetical protein
MADDYRPTEPVNVFDVPPPPLPPRETRPNSLVWVGLVVAVFMAVPFLANWATRTHRVVAVPEAASAAAPEPAASVVAAPAPRSAPVVPDRPAPVPARTLADPGQQMVTKCIERGRVVYTQTGECAGSVSAVPIDTGKNVVGPGAAASR